MRIRSKNQDAKVRFDLSHRSSSRGGRNQGENIGDLGKMHIRCRQLQVYMTRQHNTHETQASQL